jgi:hypothetical protein
MAYTINPHGGVIRDADGAFIPADPSNSDYAAYLAWVAAGHAATPAGETLAQAVQRLSDSVDCLVADIYSNWTRFEREYELREDAARTFKATGYVGDPGQWVSAFATSAGLPNQQATDLIIVQADQLHAALATLGALRMRKYEILGAASIAAAQAAYNDISASINTVAEGLS